MRDDVDPVEILDDVTPELERILENPYIADSGVRKRFSTGVKVDSLMYEEAEVNIENGNVKVRTGAQSSREGYTAVFYRGDAAFVINETEMRKDPVVPSRMHYLVTEEETLKYVSRRWQETENPAVRDVAEMADKLYRKAKEKTETSQETEKESRSGRPVPPPTEGDFTE